ncbi:uncharacterized protein KY384_003385 [Bacidia gigantensis]|uniref:uncharacterized protein n=1 Tax=Bacidia gigantensis TaxID=2732470 RepID=UPI001D0550B9|nr:uncharacterized protein KY384_003385 [Bacidia gigantensis]KAG8531753.1 hypothetical protein KY384_003385 [Bacidia gigantensis]
MRRYKRDNNPERGVSPMRRRGFKKPLSIRSKVRVAGLPKPVLDPERRSRIEVDPNHGLWGFFNEKKELLTPPDVEASHGRAWYSDELRHKSWEDLHSVWWMCCRERNRLATESAERQRLRIKQGNAEAHARDLTLRRTMKSIKWALTERYYAWEGARALAEKDPEVDMDAADLEQPIYGPMTKQVSQGGRDDR